MSNTMKTIDDLIKDIVGEANLHLVTSDEFIKSGLGDEAKQALSTMLSEIIGEDYIFERPADDYLPNNLIHLKAKNDLRVEQRKRATDRGFTKGETE